MRTLGVGAMACALVVLLSACSSGDNAQNAVAIGGTFQFHSPGGQTVITYPEDERAPIQEFSGASLMEEGTGNTKAADIKLSDFEGQVVVLNAWGQWCAPCRSEADDLQEIHEQLLPLGGTVLGINVRDYSQQIAQDFVRDNGITFPSLYDPPFRTAAAFGGVPNSVIPTTIVLDKQHRPAAVFLQEITADQVLEVALPLAQED